jgi:hypothetical protein
MGCPLPISYPQHDEELCLTHCTASALAWQGYSSAADFVASLGGRLLAQWGRGPYLQQSNYLRWLSSESHAVLQRSGLQPRALRSFPVDKESFLERVLRVMERGEVVVFQMLDSEGAVNHTAAAAGPFLFDSRKAHTLPLTVEGLDASTQSGNFRKVLYALRIVPLPNAGFRRQ